MQKKIFNSLGFIAISFFAIYELYRNYIYITSTNEINSDALYTYLPAARRLLEDPITFLTIDPLSHYTAPLGYIWPAIWGANESLIILANCILFIAGIWLIWATSYKLGGIIAATTSTLLLIKHPSIIYYIPKVLTEAIFFFGLALLIWALIEIILNKNKKIPKYAFVLGLTITLLSRPVLQFIVILSIACLILLITYYFLSKRNPDETLSLSKTILPLLLLSIVLPSAFAIKNDYYFDVKNISTGSGIGLYYGVNPMKLGIEPSFMNFTYDVGAVVKKANPDTHGDPFTKFSDQIAAMAAISTIRNTKLIDNFNFFIQKSYYWLFYSTPELRSIHSNRFYRLSAILLILFGAITIATNKLLKQSISNLDSKKTLAACIILSLFTLMWIQLTPILYNNRYNSFLLEPWLAILAGIGASLLLKDTYISISKTNKYPFTLKFNNLWKLGWIFIIYFMVIGILGLSNRYERIMIDPFRPGPASIVLDGNNMEIISSSGLLPSQNSNEWKLENWDATLQISLNTEDLSDSFSDGLWRIAFSVQSPLDQSCRKGWIGVKDAATEQLQGEQLLPRLFNDGQMQVYAISANEPLRPKEMSIMQLRLSCPPGTLLQWGGADLLKSTMPEAVEALVQQEAPINPYLVEAPFVKH